MLKFKSSLKAAACMAVAALTAQGCSQDDLADQSALKGNTVIVASFEGANTRTSVNDANQVVWNENDAFGLFYTSSSNPASEVAQFTCSNADGTKTSASFGGTLNDGVTTSYAVYPYAQDMSLSESTVTMKLPAEFAYTTASNGPMYASASDISKDISFKHLTGLLKLTVSQGIDTKAKKFVITADKNIAGTCTADLSNDAPTLAVSADGSKTITVNLAITDDGSGNITTFYIPIPVATYTSLSAKLVDESGTELYAPKEWKDITVTRAGMLTASFGYVTIDATTPADINNAVANALPKEEPATAITTNFELSGTIDATASEGAAIEIPALQNSNVGLSLAVIPTTSEEKPLVLKAPAGSSEVPAESKNTVTVSIPKVESNQTAPSFTITMPQTTVELAATSTEGTTYGKVTAKTATSTLIIKEGVTVNELVIDGGNVKIYGTVKKLTRGDGNATTVEVASEGAADIQTVTAPENFKFTSVWDGTSKIAATSGNIFTAAQLASLQSKTVPTSANSESLTATITAATKLYADIDLADKPWLGMVINAQVFDGQEHVIKNLNMSQYILDQQETTYTPQACIGLFAAVYGAATIKNITLDKVTIRPDASSSPKWVGALVGYSKGNVTTYENCIAKNVDIFTHGKASYRVGGLIGYIEVSTAAENTATAVLKGCKVETATIAASFSYGGLVGSMYDSATFENCSTSNITLKLNGECDKPYGYVSKFIGDIANEGTKKRTVIIKNCTTDALDESGLNISMGGCKWFGIVEPESVPTFTIKVTENNGGEKILVAGTDFNIVRNIAWDGNSTFEPVCTENVYSINAPSELAWISQQVEKDNTFEGKTIKLCADLDMGNKSWRPIGDNSAHKMINAPTGTNHEVEYEKTVKYFKGTFDGQNKTINNLTVNHKYPGAGLFGNVQNATIKNFNVTNATINGSSKWTAAVIGYSNGGLTVENVKVSSSEINMGNDTNGAVKLAGLVSYMNGKSNGVILLKGCSVSDFAINGAHYNAAGLAGYILTAKSFTIENCQTSNISITRSLDLNSVGAANYSSAFLGCFNKTTDNNATSVVFKNNTVSGTYTYNGGAVGLANFTISDAGSTDDSNYASFVCAPLFGDCDAANIDITINESTYTNNSGKFVQK